MPAALTTHVTHMAAYTCASLDPLTVATFTARADGPRAVYMAVVIRAVNTPSHGSDCVSERRVAYLSLLCVSLARVTFHTPLSISYPSPASHRSRVRTYVVSEQPWCNMCGKYIAYLATCAAFSTGATCDRFARYAPVTLRRFGRVTRKRRCYRLQFDCHTRQACEIPRGDYAQLRVERVSYRALSACPWPRLTNKTAYERRRKIYRIRE